jgi:hypothetical protein
MVASKLQGKVPSEYVVQLGGHTAVTYTPRKNRAMMRPVKLWATDEQATTAPCVAQVSIA